MPHACTDHRERLYIRTGSPQRPDSASVQADSPSRPTSRGHFSPNCLNVTFAGTRVCATQTAPPCIPCGFESDTGSVWVRVRSLNPDFVVGVDKSPVLG